ncbi:DUF4136 domain-containing protein [Trichloromonas sp.]|uniref:DUF4136 domain-containing protein n=1 Tax=Trichloromonas sp. TaxID=3069249 RepID=UPI003D81BB5D
MKLLRLLLLILLLTGLLACAQKPVVERSYDWKADFSSYRSWFWVDGKPALVDALVGDDRTDQLIRRAVAEELDLKGMQARADEPDLLVKYTTRFQDAVAATPGALGYSYQWRWTGEAQGRGQQQSYSKGTLIIDLIDRKTGILVWQGRGSGAITDERDAQGKIRTAVRDILAQYPPTR